VNEADLLSLVGQKNSAALLRKSSLATALPLSPVTTNSERRNGTIIRLPVRESLKVSDYFREFFVFASILSFNRFITAFIFLIIYYQKIYISKILGDIGCFPIETQVDTKALFSLLLIGSVEQRWNDTCIDLCLLLESTNYYFVITSIVRLMAIITKSLFRSSYNFKVFLFIYN